jgi:hypothetical protein
MKTNSSVRVGRGFGAPSVSVLLMLMAVGCGSRVEAGPSPGAGGPSGAGAPTSSGGEPAYGGPSNDSYAGGGNVGNSAAVQENGGTGGGTTSGCTNPNWNSSGFDYGGNFGSTPGIDCTCDVCGDSTCSGTLAAGCERIGGCRATLDGMRATVDVICASTPAYAFYSKGKQTVIAFGSSVDGDYSLVFDNETGVLVGASSSAHDGRACYLGGKTDFSAGLQVNDPKPTCRLCAADTQDPDIATVPECPDGAIP